MAPSPLYIAGAGIGGLSAACALQAAGHHVELLERIDAVREVGAGILLAPNASRHLYALGLGDALDAVSYPMSRAEVRTWRDTPLAGSQVLPDPHAPARMIHRAALQRVLLDAVGAQQVRLSSPVDHITVDDGPHLHIHLDTDSATPEPLPAWGLIGADGLHSRVRRSLHPADRDPLHYHGYTCWRGITRPFSHPGFAPETLLELQGKGLRAGMAYIDADHIYWFATANRPEGQQDNLDTLHQDLLQTFHEFPDYFLAMIDATEPAKILRNDIYDRSPLKSWARGPVTLLGDAAHPMAPNLGQGACSAIEDAATLAALLADVSPGDTSALATAFRLYEERRKPRTHKLQKLSRQFGTLGQLQNPALVRLRELAMHLAPSSLMERQQAWIWQIEVQSL